MGDYTSIDLEVVIEREKGLTDTHVFEWGDHYHDQGSERSDGAIEALVKVLGEVKIKEVCKADCTVY